MTQQDLSLVILAAGMSTRYGGLKQIEPVGPAGETIMDYTIYDARRAGFARVVFVVRKDIENAFRTSVGARYERQIPVAYAYQRLDDVPNGIEVPRGRTKPWGTTHAVLAARDEVDGPFAVANADDFYGRAAFVALAELLRRQAAGATPEYAMVGYALRDTLPEAGAVSRALCRTSPEGWLTRIEEVRGIARSGDGGRYQDAGGAWQMSPGDTPVSMNLWGFSPAFLPQAWAGFAGFLRAHAGKPDAEYYLPAIVQQLIDDGAARVRVLRTGAVWCGVTRPEDKPHVVQTIARLVAAGEYPERLHA